jgi:hypothetical protein
MKREPSTIMALPAGEDGDVAPPRRMRALPLVWLALLAIAACAVGVFIAAMPLRFDQEARVCAGVAHCDAIAAYLVALDAFTALVWLALALVVFWRRPGDRIGIFTALTLLTFGVGRFPDTPLALSAAYPQWSLPVAALRFLGSACLSIFVFVFPDGAFVPRITRWIAAAWILVQIPEFFFSASAASSDGWSPLLRFAGFLGFVLVVGAAQTWRYQRVSTTRQRQQTRWVVFGLALALLCYLALAFGYPLLRDLTSTPGPLSPVTLTSLISLTFLLVPITMTIAIARHRLYDVDLLINRALVYGSLTAALAALYLASVFVLQMAVMVVTGARQISPLAIVCSTLAVAALFQPLRRTLQREIDHRFYRRKYDANATIAAFSIITRQQIDLADLRERLIAVAQETMQPTHVSLWLRAPTRREPDGRHER